MKTLKTDRLILRAWAESDLDDFYDYAKNPNVGPSAGWQPHKDKAASQEILQKFITNDNEWAIVDKETIKVIGSLGIHQDLKREYSKSKMIGYVLSQEYWGKGIMVEAVKRAIQHLFEETDITIISVYHFPFNARSKRVIEKCGFQYEGTFRQSSQHFSGNIYDNVCYSITKEEYLAKS
ncbi:MAG: GNAT family protein [Oscillospiraceae bacterium]